jgi:hypothetical protein
MFYTALVSMREQRNVIQELPHRFHEGLPSVGTRGRRATVFKLLMVTVAKSVTIVIPGRRRDGRVAETRVTVGIRPPAVRNIVPGCIGAIVKALARDLRIGCGWGRGIVGVVTRV